MGFHPDYKWGQKNHILLSKQEFIWLSLGQLTPDVIPKKKVVIPKGRAKIFWLASLVKTVEQLIELNPDMKWPE